MEIRAVLDTNVVLAAENSSNPDSPNREIIRRWLAGDFVLLVTDDVVSEYAEKLLSIGKLPQEILRFLSSIYVLSEAVQIRFFHLRHYPADFDDVHFLLCAINGEASHLVSYDPHLLDLRAVYDDFTVCLPLQFLQDLRKLD
ncbi:MAG: PIN domain-containing protein [Chthoniobacterales bacterium]